MTDLWTTHDPADVFDAVADRLAEYLKPEPWMADAVCKEHPELSWHPGRGDTGARQKAICSTCLVREDCLAAADDEGIWGGLSPGERKKARQVRSSGRLPAPLEDEAA